MRLCRSPRGVYNVVAAGGLKVRVFTLFRPSSDAYSPLTLLALPWERLARNCHQIAARLECKIPSFSLFPIPSVPLMSD